MKFFFILILCFSQNCKAMDAAVPAVDKLKTEFFKKISYEFVKLPQIHSFSKKDKIMPISLSYFARDFKEEVTPKIDFEMAVWLLKHQDLYLEASYLWYTRLREDGGFNFNNFREFFWCLMSANTHTNIVVFTEKLLKKLKTIWGVDSQIPPII